MDWRLEEGNADGVGELGSGFLAEVGGEVTVGGRREGMRDIHQNPHMF